MSQSKPASDPVFDAENPEWTRADFAKSRPPHEVLPPEVLGAFPQTMRRGLQRAPTKVAVSIRLSREVIDHFKAEGPNWQPRIDDALRKMIATAG